MKGRNEDWFDSSNEIEWTDPTGYTVNNRKGKMKSYYIQFKDETTHSVMIDATSERDAISQVLEDLEDPNTSDVNILSIIEVDDDEE